MLVILEPTSWTACQKQSAFRSLWNFSTKDVGGRGRLDIDTNTVLTFLKAAITKMMTLCLAGLRRHLLGTLLLPSENSSQHRTSGRTVLQDQTDSHKPPFLAVFPGPSLPPTGREQEQQSRSKDPEKEWKDLEQDSCSQPKTSVLRSVGQQSLSLW